MLNCDFYSRLQYDVLKIKYSSIYFNKIDEYELYKDIYDLLFIYTHGIYKEIYSYSSVPIYKIYCKFIPNKTKLTNINTNNIS